MIKSSIVSGEMSELAKGHAWKACKAVMAPRVRVPLSPPLYNICRARWGVSGSL